MIRPTLKISQIVLEILIFLLSFINVGSCGNPYLEDGNETFEIGQCKPIKTSSFYVTSPDWTLEKVTVITECGCA